MEEKTKGEQLANQAKQAEQDTAKAAEEVTEGAIQAAKEKAEQAAQAAQDAVDSVPTADVQAKADAVAKKAAEAAKEASEKVKKGFADHGIDTDKLGSALAADAKSAATAAVGAGKFAADKVGSFVQAMRAKAQAAEEAEAKADVQLAEDVNGKADDANHGAERESSK